MSWTAPKSGEVARVAFAVALEGKGAEGYVDDCSFWYDPLRFPPEKIRPLACSADLAVQGGDMKLFVNGETIRPRKSGYRLDVYPGENVIGIHLSGREAKLNGHFLLGKEKIGFDDRWRISGQEEEGWLRKGFDDRKWKALDAEDASVCVAGGANETFLRRSIVWRGNNFLGADLTAFYFPQGSTQYVKVFLHSPTRSPVGDTWRVFFELPAFAELLPKGPAPGSGHANLSPLAIKQQHVTRGRDSYTRYTFTYPGSRTYCLPGTEQLPDDLRGYPFSNRQSIHFLKMDGKADPEKPYVFRFWREAGSSTELPREIPLIVTPPVRGKMPKRIMLFTNYPLILGGAPQKLGDEEAENMLGTLLDSGVNCLLPLYMPGLPELGKGYESSPPIETMRKRGVFLGFWNMGINYLLKENSRHVAPLASHPEYLGVRVNKPKDRVFWCHEYLAEGGELYLDLWREYYDRIRKAYPFMRFVCWDYEVNMMRTSCFCDRCVHAFRKFSNISEDKPLTEEIITTRHVREWRAFRDNQAARHVKVFKKLLAERGFEMWLCGSSALRSAHGLDLRLLPGVLDLVWCGMGAPPHDLSAAFRENDRIIEAVKTQVIRQIMPFGAQVPTMRLDPRRAKLDVLRTVIASRGGVSLWNGVVPAQEGGVSFFVGEATRAIADFEDFILHGDRLDLGQVKISGLSASADVGGFRKDGRMVLFLFNREEEPVTVNVEIPALKDKAYQASEYYTGKTFPDASSIMLELAGVECAILRVEKKQK